MYSLGFSNCSSHQMVNWRQIVSIKDAAIIIIISRKQFYVHLRRTGFPIAIDSNVLKLPKSLNCFRIPLVLKPHMWERSGTSERILYNLNQHLPRVSRAIEILLLHWIPEIEFKCPPATTKYTHTLSLNF